MHMRTANHQFDMRMYVVRLISFALLADEDTHDEAALEQPTHSTPLQLLFPIFLWQQ